MDEITFASLSPRLASRDLLLASPYDPAVWFLVSFWYLLISVLMYRFSRKSVPQNQENSCKSFSLILFALFSICIQKPIQHIWRVRSTGIRVILCVWMACGLILSIGYCTKLYSILAVPRYEDPIDTVEQLVQGATVDSHFVMTKKYAALWNRFMSAGAGNEVYHLFGQHMKR